MANPELSKLQHSTQESFALATASRESSGAHLGPIFSHLSDVKKFIFQGLNFLFDNFVLLVWGLLLHRFGG